MEKTHTQTQTPPYNFSRKRRWNKEHTHWKENGVESLEWACAVLLPKRRAERLRMFMTPHFRAAVMFAPGRTSPQCALLSYIRNERGRFPGKPSSKVYFIFFCVPEVLLLVDSRVSQNFSFFFSVDCLLNWICSWQRISCQDSVCMCERIKGNSPLLYPKKSTTVSGALHDDDETADISFFQEGFFFFEKI